MALLGLAFPGGALALRPTPGDTCFFAGAPITIQQGLRPHTRPAVIACRVFGTGWGAESSTIELMRFMRWNFGDPCPSDMPEIACHYFGAPIWVVRIRGSIRLCAGVGPCGTVATMYFLLSDETGELFAFGTP